MKYDKLDNPQSTARGTCVSRYGELKAFSVCYFIVHFYTVSQKMRNGIPQNYKDRF